MLAPRLAQSDASWYVIRTHYREEWRAAQNLGVSCIEAFLPRMRAPRASRSRGGPAATALFPQYLFAHFDPARSLRDVHFTRGVQGIIRFGTCLATVDDEVIALFRSRMDAQGLIDVGEPLRPGERVLIEHGPFAALAGVVERHLPDKERVTVLLTCVQSGVHVEVATDAVRRSGSADRSF
jgi:transcriptional antiterminator RfaH